MKCKPPSSSPPILSIDPTELFARLLLPLTQIAPRMHCAGVFAYSDESSTSNELWHEVLGSCRDSTLVTSPSSFLKLFIFSWPFSIVQPGTLSLWRREIGLLAVAGTFRVEAVTIFNTEGRRNRASRRQNLPTKSHFQTPSATLFPSTFYFLCRHPTQPSPHHFFLLNIFLDYNNLPPLGFSLLKNTHHWHHVHQHDARKGHGTGPLLSLHRLLREGGAHRGSDSPAD